MNRHLLIALVSLVFVMGMLVDNTIAQPPPQITVSLALAGSCPDVPNRLVYRTVDPIQVVLTLKNDAGQNIITSKGFQARKFYLFLTFIDPDGKGIIAQYFENVEAKDPPPPPVIPLADGTLPQVEPVEILPANWAPLPYVLPNAHAYYRLTKPGNYSVKAIIHMGTFPEVFYTDPVTQEKYAKIENPLNWAGDLLSNTVYFTLLTDADKDGYYVPEGYPPGALADCNDSDPNEHPNQTWYIDSDNDGYGNPNTSVQACSRPAGYVTNNLDCNDSDPAVNPGATEIPNNGKDDDCNPATPDGVGTINVTAIKYTIGLGTRPLVTQTPISGMPVRAFAKSPGSCAAQYGIISWPHYKDIWNGCPVVAEGNTNASGKVALSVPPGTYIVIGKYDEMYAADNVLGLKAGGTKKAFLPFIVIATGKGLSCKYSQQIGSDLLIIEPEHVEWDGAQELYPFVFQSEGDWAVETSVTPPEGFVTDYNALSTEVNTTLKSVQFTLTDIGSKWTDTKIKHRVKHKGKWKTISTKIGVKLSEKLAKKKGLTVFGEKIKK